MSGAMQTIFGIPISTSPYIPEFTFTPNKRHECRYNKPRDKKQLMYHKRIQKKWNKRFGIKKERCVYNLFGELVVHPNTLAIIKASKDSKRYMGIIEREERQETIKQNIFTSNARPAILPFRFES